MASSLSSLSHPYRTSSDQTHKTFWRTIWNLNIPNKLKTFAWRASLNILPTKVNLCHHGVLDNPTCEACGLSDEASGHLFWDCTSACETWEAAGIPIDLRGVQYREFIDLLWHLIFVQHVGKDLLEFVITTAWCMWLSRNKTILGAPRQSCREIIHKACTMREDVDLHTYEYHNTWMLLTYIGFP